MRRSVILLLSVSGCVFASINEGMSDSLDGEVAMKNLEAAQVKMEEKLNSMTNFIDQELNKAKDSPVADSYRRRKRSTEKNPLLRIPQDKVKDIITAMKTLNDEFTNLQGAYEDYKNSMANDVKGMEKEVGYMRNDVEQAEGEEEEEISDDIGNDVEQAEGEEEREEEEEEENANEEVTEYEENVEEPEQYDEDEQKQAERKQRRRRKH